VRRASDYLNHLSKLGHLRELSHPGRPRQPKRAMRSRPLTPGRSNNSFGVLILAAGLSTRLGQPKARIRYRGVELLSHTLARAAALDPQWIGVVVNRALRAVIPPAAGVDRIINPAPEQGMGLSLALGVAKAPKRLGALLIVTVDQWALTRMDLKRLCRGGGQCRVAAYDNTLGIPALFPRRWFKQLQRLGGEQGAKRLIMQATSQQLPSPVIRVALPHAGYDLDTARDLHSLRAYQRRPTRSR